jgi:hypothetical protein
MSMAGFERPFDRLSTNGLPLTLPSPSRGEGFWRVALFALGVVFLR